MKAVRVLCSCFLFSVLGVEAANTNQAFERGALSPEQIHAWEYYTDTESAVYGCQYGDDPRFAEDSEGLLKQLASDEEMDPVQVTYRTLMNMGPNTRALVSRNVRVASIECNAVYYVGTDLIGLPVIPFEEALTLLHDDLANYTDENRVRQLRDTFIVANIDPRWFWTYFVADKDHLEMLGLDYDTLLVVETALRTDGEKGEYSSKSYTLLHDIFVKLHNRSIDYYSSDGKCQKTTAEPPFNLLVWPEITDEIVKSLYVKHAVSYRGKWRVKAEKVEGGTGLSRERPIDNADIPLFNVERGLSISSAECS